MSKFTYVMFCVLFAVLSCATVNHKKGNEMVDLSMYNISDTYIHQDFEHYVNEFIENSQGSVKWKRLEGLVMDYNEVAGDRAIGQCSLLFEKRIDISPSWWQRNTNYLQRKQLIYHELGHCILLRNHSEPAEADYSFIEKLMFFIGIFKRQYELVDGCEPSIMHPTMVSWHCMSVHEDYYVEELFKRTDYKKRNEELKKEKKK